MIKKSTLSRARTIILKGGLAVLITAGLVVTMIDVRHYRTLKDCTLFNSEFISTEYAKKQYASAITESEIEFRIKALAARASLLMSTMVELDPNNEIFTDTQFTNGLLYCDWVVYGDSQIKASNTIDGKCLILNNALDTISTNSTKINVLIYNLGNNKVSYKYIWKGFNDDIDALNQLLMKYNESSDTNYARIHHLESIGE